MIKLCYTGTNHRNENYSTTTHINIARGLFFFSADKGFKFIFINR